MTIGQYVYDTEWHTAPPEFGRLLKTVQMWAIPKHHVSEGRKKKEEKGKNKRKGNQSDEEDITPKSGGRKKKPKKAETDSAIASVLPGLSIAHPSDVLDMPVDPNEPTYCLCHQVSYGEMIACDKMDVCIVWYFLVLFCYLLHNFWDIYDHMIWIKLWCIV